MSLFNSFWAPRTPRLEPDWMTPLPPKLAGLAVMPRAAVVGETLVVWGEGLAIGLDPSDGRTLYKVKLGSWHPAGFDAEGQFALVNGSRHALLVSATGEIIEAPVVAEPERSARDAAEHPEEDPTLWVGRRLFRVRGETRSRVTRHWIELTDEGHVAQRVEVAAFTLRSDRLVLTDRGGGRIYGWVGMDSECPSGAVVGGASGPIVVLRRRFPGWHEHNFPEDEPDLVGHGPANLSVMIVRTEETTPRSRELGTAPESWEGLGWRGGPHPPYLKRALGVRPVGLAAGKIIVELTDLTDGAPDSSLLTPRRRFLAGFGTADMT